MTNVEEINKENVEFLSTKPGRIAKLLLQDLRSLRRDEEQLFNILFFNREEQIDTLVKYIEDARDLGENILVIASPGVGKTCLLLKCLNEHKLSQKKDMHPIFCDCREEGDVRPGLVTVRNLLISCFKSYLTELTKVIGEDVTPAELKMAQDEQEQYRLSVRAIRDLKKSQVDKLYPILFIDDIDYSERLAQEELLNMLLPLLQCRNIVVIYAVRPPSARTIDFHFDNRVKMAFSRARRLYLGPISVRGHLTTRLAYLIDEPNEDSFVKRKINSIWQTDPLKRYLAQFIEDKDLERFPYPFHGRVETFMQRITNGNINEIVDITLALLSYCHNNKKTLKASSDGTYDLHRIHVTDALNSTDSLYKIFNIHQVKSQKRGRSKQFHNNSTIQNVLEMFCFTHYADDDFFNRLCGKVSFEDSEGFGHTRDEVRRAIDLCLNERLIEEEVFATGGPSLFLPKSIENRDIGPFLLTQKGEFYIHDFMFWPSYPYREENSINGYFMGRSVFGLTDEGEVGRFELEGDVIEFLLTLVSVTPPGKGYLKVGKKDLYDFFYDNYKQAYWHKYEDRRKDGGEGYSTLTQETFEGLIIRREFCSPHRIDNRKYFTLRTSKIHGMAKDANISTLFNADRFSKSDFIGFCQKSTSWSEEE